MEILIKAAAAAVVAAILGLVIKKSNPEATMLLALGAVILLLTFALSAVTEITDFMRELGGFAGISSGIVSIVLKTTGIGIMAKISADVCRDSGQQALASAVEFTGAAAAMYVALPLFRSVLETMESLM